jgi:hypothetical protein
LIEKLEHQNEITNPNSTRSSEKISRWAGDKRRRKMAATKKQAALDIDPETAKVFWDYRYMHDPYGIVAAPAQEYDERYGWVMREYFAWSPR